MKPILDIAFTLGMLLFLITAAAVTARTFNYAALLLSWFRRRLSDLKNAPRETKPIQGILLNQEENA